MLLTNIVFDILKVHTMTDTGSASYPGKKIPLHKHWIQALIETTWRKYNMTVLSLFLSLQTSSVQEQEKELQ